MSIPGTPTGGPFGKNALISHDELVTTEIGQIQTQFDGPGHIGVNTSKGPMMYNDVIAWDAYEHGAGGRVVGMGPLGVEHPGELGFVCRVVVLDAVAYKKSKGVIPAGAEMLPIPTKPGDPGIVTADDVRGMLQMQGLRDIPPGHLEPGERRHQVARRQEDPGGRVHLGAAADHWRYRLARQSDGALLVEYGGPRNGPPYPPTLVAPRRSRGAPRSPTLVAPRGSRGAPRYSDRLRVQNRAAGMAPPGAVSCLMALHLVERAHSFLQFRLRRPGVAAGRPAEPRGRRGSVSAWIRGGRSGRRR